MAKKKGLLDKVKEAVIGEDVGSENTDETVDASTETAPETDAPEVTAESVLAEADGDQLYSLEEVAKMNDLKRRGFRSGKIALIIEEDRKNAE